MQVFNIHEMRWANVEKNSVYMVADTNTGERELIGTPYNAESIVWSAVRQYPVDQILPMLPPEPITTPAEEEQDIVDVVSRPVE
jgi:hypothetical protein